MANIYYEDDLVTIYHGDVLDILPTLSGFDLAFADPPFNVGLNYGKDKDQRDNYYEWQSEWVKQTYDALNERGTFYLMTITRHLSEVYRVMGQGHFINQVNWKNVSSVSSKRQYWNHYQPILVYGKTDQYYFDTYAQISMNGKQRWGEYKTERKGQMGDVWDDIPFVYAGSIRHKEAILLPGTNRKAHPAQMPESLSHRILSFSCPLDGMALEVFMGTGTTLRVAKDLGIKAIGIELNESYCEIAAERMRQPRIPLRPRASDAVTSVVQSSFFPND